MSRVVLLSIVAAFLTLRLPPVLKQAGGPDEEFYAVPGLTVAREGIPRIPFSRATDPHSLFYGAERLLLTMPPLTFYAQAPFFLVFPPTYATARLASMAAGCVAIVLVYAIARLLWQDESIALWAAGIYSVSRLLYFPAMIARPDMLCGTLCLGAFWAMCRWSQGRRWTWLIAAGVLLGLAGLTHPFAVVVATQLGAWAVLAPGTARTRLLRLAGLAASALLAFSAWLVLILREPALFGPQFIANVITPTGPGLGSRLLFPWEELTEHLPLVVERAGPIQIELLSLCLLTVTWLAWRRRDRALGLVSAMGWSSVYLLLGAQGRHPLQGYWCYSVAFFAMAAGWCASRFVAGFRPGPRAVVARIFVVILLVAAFVPGGGLKTTWACVRHWGATDYNPREFTREILREVPANVRLTVGAEYALDAYGLGRDVLLGIRYPLYYDATKHDYDYAIMGRAGLQEGLDRAMNGRIVRRFGDESDPFACSAVLLVPDRKSAK